MATPVTLSGGAFQDSQGNVLANGYLKFQLSQDGTVPGSGNVASGIEIQINLDVNGNVVGGQSLWGNDVITPSTFYRVTGYTSKGQPAWGPNNQQVTGASFNLSTWVPNQLISSPTQVSPVTLENNGVLNLSQTVLNLESTDASVTIQDLGSGNINLKASVAAFSSSGQGYFTSWESFKGYGTGGGNGGSWLPASLTANTVLFTTLNLTAAYTIRKVTVQWISNSAGGPHFSCVAIYNATGTTKLLDAGTNAFSDSNITTPQTVTLGTPVTLQPGTYLVAWSATVTAGSGAFAFAFPTAQVPTILNQNVVRYGTASNVLSGGAMPATLGTLTVRNVADTFAGFLFEG